MNKGWNENCVFVVVVVVGVELNEVCHSPEDEASRRDDDHREREAGYELKSRTNGSGPSQENLCPSHKDDSSSNV